MEDQELREFSFTYRVGGRISVPVEMPRHGMAFSSGTITEIAIKDHAYVINYTEDGDGDEASMDYYCYVPNGEKGAMRLEEGDG